MTTKEKHNRLVYLLLNMPDRKTQPEEWQKAYDEYWSLHAELFPGKKVKW